MEGRLQRILGQNVRAIRSGRGLSQEEFAELLGVHRTYVGGIERGERNLSLRSVERLADALDTEPLALLVNRDDGEAALLRAAATGTGPLPDARALPTRERPVPDEETS